MDLFTYLMAKRGHNSSVHGDLASYLWGKGQAGTYVTKSGVSVTVSNSLKGKIKNWKFKGMTSQDGTPTPDNSIPVKVVTGDNEVLIRNKNLYNVGTVSDYIIGTALNDLTISDNMLMATIKSGASAFCIKNENYYINNAYLRVDYSNSGSVARLLIRAYNQNNEIITSSVSGWAYNSYYKAYYKDSNEGSFSLTTASYIQVGLVFVGTTNEQGVYSNIMLIEGTTPSEYIEHQSQTYPISLDSIELCKIGTYQDKIAKSTGKNLFDKSSANIIQNKYLDSSGVETNDNSFSISDYIKVQSNTIYSSQPYESKVACICFYDNNKSFLSSIALAIVNPNFTTPNNCEYIRVSIWKADINIIQIEKGSTATTYEPYGKVWYLHKEIGKVVLDGSENGWNKISYSFYIDGLFTGKVLSLCDYFTNSGSSWDSSDENYRGKYTTTNADGQFKCMPLVDMTTEEFKTWLSTHNTTLYYALETPIGTQITDTTLINQLNDIYNHSKSYDGVTNITTTYEDGNEQMILEFDIKTSN